MLASSSIMERLRPKSDEVRQFWSDVDQFFAKFDVCWGDVDQRRAQLATPRARLTNLQREFGQVRGDVATFGQIRPTLLRVRLCLGGSLCHSGARSGETSDNFGAMEMSANPLEIPQLRTCAREPRMIWPPPAKASNGARWQIRRRVGWRLGSVGLPLADQFWGMKGGGSMHRKLGKLEDRFVVGSAQPGSCVPCSCRVWRACEAVLAFTVVAAGAGPVSCNSSGTRRDPGGVAPASRSWPRWCPASLTGQCPNRGPAGVLACVPARPGPPQRCLQAGVCVCVWCLGGVSTSVPAVASVSESTSENVRVAVLRRRRSPSVRECVMVRVCIDHTSSHRHQHRTIAPTRRCNPPDRRNTRASGSTGVARAHAASLEVAGEIGVAVAHKPRTVSSPASCAFSASPPRYNRMYLSASCLSQSSPSV